MTGNHTTTTPVAAALRAAPGTECRGYKARLRPRQSAHPCTKFLSQSAIANRQSAAISGFTLVELLAMILLLAVIVTITGMVLRETRLASARITGNEEASHTASRVMELIQRDVERAIVLPNPSFIVGSEAIATEQLGDTAVLLTDSSQPAVPVGGTGMYLRAVILSDSASLAPSNRAASEVFYWLAFGVSNAFPTLLRAERRLTTDEPGAYAATNWMDRTSGLVPEVVARFVTDFSIRCTDGEYHVYDSWARTELPVCVDLYLEYLPESAAARLKAKGAMADLVEIERSVTKTSCRFFLPNRRGYTDGK